MDPGIFVHHPGHDLRVRVHVGRRDVPLRADLLADALDEPPRHALQFAGGKQAGVHGDAALGPAEGQIDQRCLPRHERSQGADVFGIHRRMVTEAAFHGAARGIVLDAVSRKNRQFSIVALDGHGNVMFAFGREEQLLDTGAEVHRLRSLADVVIGLFEGAHDLGNAPTAPTARG